MNTVKSNMRHILFALMAILLISNGFAQPPRGNRQPERRIDQRKEAIEARRVSYITTKLSLSPEEAREFWPIYNEYTRKVDEISEGFRKQQETLPDPEFMNEQQAAQFVEAELKRFEQSSTLRREYTEKLLDILSIQQVALLFDAERNFNRMFFREAQRRHRQDTWDRDNN